MKILDWLRCETQICRKSVKRMIFMQNFAQFFHEIKIDGKNAFDYWNWALDKTYWWYCVFAQSYEVDLHI